MFSYSASSATILIFELFNSSIAIERGFCATLASTKGFWPSMICLALLDENDNGFIINSVHSSAGCYSYTKRIQNGKCELDLSGEEKIAIEKAINNQ